jgi:hypothetical protein
MVLNAREMEYKKLTIEEIEDLTQRACVQLVPELTTKLLSMVVELIEYKKKIEQGTLIDLPCKVGDTVYKVEREYGYSNDTYFWHIVEKPFELGMLDYWWGKMIFLTREEAKKRLKELQNG